MANERVKEEPEVAAAVREDPVELLLRAAEALEAKRGGHAKTYQSVAAQARALAERLAQYK